MNECSDALLIFSRLRTRARVDRTLTSSSIVAVINYLSVGSGGLIHVPEERHSGNKMWRQARGGTLEAADPLN
jgi:hypothetical protein